MLAQENVDAKKHYFPNYGGPLCFSKSFDALLFHPEVNLEEGKFFGVNMMLLSFLGLFNEKINSSMCLFTDRSCVENS